MGRAFLRPGQHLADPAPILPPDIEIDDLAAALVFAVRLGYREIGLVDLDRPNDLVEPPAQVGSVAPAQLDALAALRAALFEMRQGIRLHTLNECCPIAKAGLCAFRAASEFFGFRRLDAIVCPLTPRERDRALTNLELWSKPSFAPYLSPPAKPEIDLVFVYNCAEDPSLADPLREAFARSPILRRMFRDIRVTFLGLSGEDDLYVRTNSGPLPRYGYKAGPNLLFFGFLRSLRHYRGFAFMMETDCVPIQPGWAQSLDALCRQRPHAWVIGSLYRGPGLLGNAIKRHINGNAIYAVGDPHFQRFLDSGYLVWLKFHIEQAEPDLAFDTAWERFANEASAELRGDAAWQVTQEIYARFVACDEIVNIAGEAELTGRVAWSLEALRETFPFAVVAHGPVAPDARNLERTSLVRALSRLTEHYMLSAANKGLKLDRWLSEGAGAVEEPFRWTLGDGRAQGRCGVRFRRDHGRMRPGDRLRVDLALSCDKPARLRVRLQLTDHVWTRSDKEMRLHGGASESLAVATQLSREVEFAQLVLERTDQSPGPVELSIERIEIRLDTASGETLALRLSPMDAAALGYGALSAIGPAELRTPPRAMLAESKLQPVPASDDGAATGNRTLEKLLGRDEPIEVGLLRPRYRIMQSRRGDHVLARSGAATGSPERRIARLTIAEGRIRTIDFQPSAPAAKPSLLKRRRDHTLAVPVPDGRRSLVAFLKARADSAGGPAALPLGLRATAEELVCYWSDIETLAEAAPARRR